jgi:hypothetical protein
MAFAQLFNLGQFHHHAQLRFGTDGHVPQWYVDSLKSVTPKEWHSFARKSGTVSNNWTLDKPGYNFLIHDVQINRNANFREPSRSYMHAFVEFYHQWGFDSLIYTLNTHEAFINGDEKQLYEALHFMLNNGINITHICLSNEEWMDFRLMGISGGTPNVGEKIKYAGVGGIFRPNPWFERFVKADMNRFLDYLEKTADSVRKIIPGVVILQTVDATTHLRGRWLWEEVQKRKYFDGITPHIYVKASNRNELQQQINARLNMYGGQYPIYVTEFNYAAGNNCDNNNPPEYFKSKQFIHDGVDIFLKDRRVKLVAVHTLSHGEIDCNSYIRRW